MITPEEALDIFKQKFFELYPKESCPSWLFSHTQISHSHTIDHNKYRCTILAMTKVQLKENEFYEELKGREIIGRIDPETQQKKYYLNYGFEIFPVFQAIIDLETSTIDILINEDIYSIDSQKLRKLRNVISE
ncbi:hypothetical protein [Roseofilum sp. Guam]|uniref:hypothetical protein n=1 Tax=Roseofilum sp. Guam TaxID=2821502 RepID=UPI001B184218|nr:hypothetical protein [Roseofilum sp. Guam]MBP0030003.1 hypothetical protein [Roseofilum sp. Guam]